MVDYERLNYEAQQPVSQVTPGLDLVIRDDVILTSSQLFPTPDSTHACSLKTTSEKAEALLDEVVTYFQDQGLPVTVFLSPHCTPDDWEARLLQRGFTKHEDEETWVLLENLADFEFRPGDYDGQNVQLVTPETLFHFAEIFLVAFDMPTDYASGLVEVLTPSLSVPDIFYFLAYEDGKPVGTTTLLRQGEVGVIGSGAVLPEYRRKKMIMDLFTASYQLCQRVGIQQLLGQSRTGSYMEKLLLGNNFKLLFRRQGYSLHMG